MKSVLSLAILCLFSFSGLAGAKNLSLEEFNTIENAFALETNAAYPIWNTGHSVCQAQTRCPNGQIAYCKTFASASQIGYGASTGVCRWMVIPGRAVRCQGYALKRDFYGRSYYAYVDVPVSCF